MQYSLIFFIIMLLGFANGFIVSLLVLIRTKSDIFLRLIALGILLFDLTILREFLFVFGDEIKLNIYIENFLHLKLWVVAIVIIAYDIGSTKGQKINTKLLIPGAIEFFILGIISFGLVGVPKIISDSLYILPDLVAFFWLLFVFYQKKKESTKRNPNLRFMFLFVLGFMLIFITRIIQFIAVIVDSSYLYRFHFLLRIITIGVIIYTISIYLIGVFLNQFKRKSSSGLSIRPKNKELLNNIKNDQKYLERNLTLEKLASYYEVDSKTLSATIREHENSSFNDYLNSLRLEYFMLLIEASEHKKFTIIALAEKSGFNSKATFNRVFKKKHLTSPSLFIDTKNK